jgi:hypothetical protein
MICPFLPDHFQLMNGFDVFRASHRLLGADEGFDLQDSAFMSVEIDRLAKTFHFIKTALFVRISLIEFRSKMAV